MPEDRTEAERVASVETEVRQVKEMLTIINAKLDTWNQTYVPRPELSEMFRSRDKDIEELKADKRDNKNNWPNWFAAIIALVALAYSLIHP